MCQMKRFSLHVSQIKYKIIYNKQKELYMQIYLHGEYNSELFILPKGANIVST